MACVKSVLWPALFSNVVDVSLSGGSLGYWTACNTVKRYCTVPYCEHIDYSELHNISSYSEQHAKYSEQYVNFSEQHVLWFLYKISSSAACSYGVWTLEIAILLLILVMIETNGKMSKKWSKWIKSGANWARIRASNARLAVYVTFYFPRNMIKNTCIKDFLPQWDSE